VETKVTGVIANIGVIGVGVGMAPTLLLLVEMDLYQLERNTQRRRSSNWSYRIICQHQIYFNP